MNRRGFLGALAAVAAAPFVPAPRMVPILFQRDAFSFVMADIDLPCRFDVIHGVSVIHPSWAMRVSSEDNA